MAKLESHLLWNWVLNNFAELFPSALCMLNGSTVSFHVDAADKQEIENHSKYYFNL